MNSSEAIQVVLRVKPRQIEQSDDCLLSYSGHEVVIGKSIFCFDKIFGEECTQQEIFNNVGLKLIDNVLQGFNSCVFAYGQTGSGKTHTMVGQGDGVIYRSLENLFARMQNQDDVDYVATCSYFQIYNEQIIDLLEPSSKKLNVREDIKKGVFIQNLSEEAVTNYLSAIGYLNSGIRCRHIGQTQMNRQSSRSHAVFSLNLQAKTSKDGIVVLKSSKMHFIDLAGSERQKSTACVGQRLKEASNINKSLTTLGMVINSLSSDKHRHHVPFRDSKLTFFLRDSLSGNSKTYIIATIANSSQSFQETLSTLKFAQRAKLVKLSAHVNEQSFGNNIQALQAEITRLRDELNRTKHQLRDERNHRHQILGDLQIHPYNDAIRGLTEKVDGLLRLMKPESQHCSRDEFKQIVDIEMKNMVEEIATLRQSLKIALTTPQHEQPAMQIEYSLDMKLQLEQAKLEISDLYERLESKDIAISQLTSRNLQQCSFREQIVKFKQFYEDKQIKLLEKLETSAQLTIAQRREIKSQIVKSSENALTTFEAAIQKISTTLKKEEDRNMAENGRKTEEFYRQLHEVKLENIKEKLKNEALSMELTHHKQNHRQLQLRHDQLKKQILTRNDYARQECSKYEEAMTAMKNQVEVMKADFEQKIQSLTQNNVQLSNEVDVLNQTNDFNNSQIERLKKIEKDMEDNLKWKQTLCRQLQTTINDKQNQITTMHGDLSRMNLTSSNLQNIVAQQSQRILSLTNDVKLKSDCVAEYGSKVCSMMENYNVLEKEKNSQIEKLQKNIEKMEKELQLQINKYQELQSESRQKQQHYEQDVRKLQNMNESKLSEQKEYLEEQSKSKIHELTKQFEEAHRQNLQIIKVHEESIRKFQEESIRLKDPSTLLLENETLKEKVNELAVNNYKLKSREKLTDQDLSNPSRLQAKINYYQDKFNLMKIQYSNSLEAVRKLKQRQLELKERNATLEEKMQSIQLELHINTKQDLDMNLQKENQQLKMMLQSKRKDEKKENKNQSEQLLAVVRLKIINVLENLVESLGEGESKLLSRELSNNMKEKDEVKQILKALELFQEHMKAKASKISKRQASLVESIRKEEKLKCQNSLVLKQNIYLKGKVKQLEESETCLKKMKSQ